MKPFVQTFPPTKWELEFKEEPMTTDTIEQEVEECLKKSCKDGLARVRVEDIENCFW